MESIRITPYLIVLALCLGFAALAVAQPPAQQDEGGAFPEPELPDNPDEFLELPEVGDDVDAYSHLAILQPPGRIQQLDLSEDAICALTYANITTCWSMADGTLTAGPDDLLAAISAGANHFCGLDFSSRAYCWATDTEELIEAPTDPIVDVAAGDGHSCALDAAGAPICWGDLDEAHRNPPGGPYSMITAGGDRTCASGAWETSRCWGGDAPSQPFREPIQNLTMSSDIICALDITNQPICEFDTGTASFEPPSPIAVDLAVGQGFVCTLDPAGGLTCAGPRAPELPESPPISRLIEASEDTLCAVTAWEEIQCFGEDGRLFEE